MKPVSFLLCVIILLGSWLPRAEYAELAKLPELYQHYQIHLQRSNGEMSLARFLLMHYADAKHKQSENHEKLPFQHQHHSCVGIVFYYLPVFDFKLTPIQQTANVGFRYRSLLLHSYLTSIFQPPKA